MPTGVLSNREIPGRGGADLPKLPKWVLDPVLLPVPDS